MSLARRDLSITESLAAAFAHLHCLCFSKNGERFDEENRRVSGDVNIWQISGDRRRKGDEIRCMEGKRGKWIAEERKCLEEKNETAKRTEDGNSPREKSLKEAICECI